MSTTLRKLMVAAAAALVAAVSLWTAPSHDLSGGPGDWPAKMSTRK